MRSWYRVTSAGVQRQACVRWPKHPQGHGRVAFLPFTPIRLKCKKPKDYRDEPRTLGEHIRKRRRESGLTLGEVGTLLRVTEYSVFNWEHGRTQPAMAYFPAIFRFLGYDPSPEPRTVGERLLRKRQKMGWAIERAAAELGVDEATWTRWETGRRVLIRGRHRELVSRLLEGSW